MKPIGLLTGSFVKSDHWVNTQLESKRFVKYDKMRRQAWDEKGNHFLIMIIPNIKDVNRYMGIELQEIQLIDGSDDIHDFEEVMAHLRCRIRP